MTTSRLPQRKKTYAAHAGAGVAHAPSELSAQDVHAALAAIGHTSSTSARDLERILQGPAGTAVRFVATHLLGRPKVAHVRAELQRLRAGRGADGVYAQHTRAAAKLERARKDVAARQGELTALQAELEASTEVEIVAREKLATDRKTAHLFQLLLTKEKHRTARIANLNLGPPILPSMTPVPLLDVLRQIRAVLRHEGETLASGVILGATCSAAALRQLHALVENVVRRIDDTKPSSRGEDFLEVLTVLRIYQVKLARTLLPRSLSRGIEIKVTRQLRADAVAQLPTVHAPSRAELDGLRMTLERAQVHAQTLLGLYQLLLESAGHVTSELRARVQGPLRALLAAAYALERALTGYVETQRQRMAARVSANEIADRGEIRGVMILPRGMGRIAMVARIEEMISQTAAVSKIVERRSDVRVSPIDRVLLEGFLEGQHGAEKHGLGLLTRKGEKMSVKHVLERDIERYVEERASVVAGRVG